MHRGLNHVLLFGSGCRVVALILSIRYMYELERIGDLVDNRHPSAWRAYWSSGQIIPFLQVQKRLFPFFIYHNPFVSLRNIVVVIRL